MIKKIVFEDFSPLNIEQLESLQSITNNFSPLQLAWISGYLWNTANNANKSLQINNINKLSSITILSASQTGNARQIAETLYSQFINIKINVKLINIGEYKYKKITQEELLIIIISTHGIGEPPEEAINMHKYLFSKQAPKLNNIYYAVFSLGDNSYEHFAQAGKDFDFILSKLGANRIHDRIDADLDYSTKANIWCQEIINLTTTLISKNNHDINQLKLASYDNINKYRHAYTKNTPLFARIILNQKITSRNSNKDVRHIEIDLADSKLNYQPGDTLGILYENDPKIVKELLMLLSLKEETIIQTNGQSLSLEQSLKKYYELNKNSPAIIKKYASIIRDKALLKLITNKHLLKQFSCTMPFISMIRLYKPKIFNTEQLLSLLHPLIPRFYSISSAQAEVENEVHITVNVVRYYVNNHEYKGSASNYLANCDENDMIKIFVKSNNNFYLPKDNTLPIIMIGPGTGIAPFRAFMQQRAANGASGKNWLFFGNPHFIDDFLYQLEWQRYVKNGVLTKIDVAWSQDQEKKIYVQDKLKERGDEIWHWIKDGAHIYVCGDVNQMVHCVENTLINIFSVHGNMLIEQANDFLNNLRIENRYHRDVY